MNTEPNNKGFTREDNDRTSLNLFQKIYVACGLIYGMFWLKKDRLFDFLSVGNMTFFITSIGILLMTLIVLIYDHRRETRKVNKACCNCIALFSTGCFVYNLLKMFLA